LNPAPFANTHWLEESRKTPEMVVMPMGDEDVIDGSDSFSLELVLYVWTNVYDCGLFTN
jgi:hypothetical protein